MEEKNRLIEKYINEKVKELESMSMYTPKESVDKLLNAFINREEDIEIIKTKIDTIFNNSVKSYQASLEKIGSSYEEMVEAYHKIEKMNKTKAKLYLAGGLIPYLLLNEASKRTHMDLNFLCHKNDARMIREVFRKNDLYDPKKDSLTYTVNNIDYGFQFTIDKVRVNISLFEETDEGITEYEFDYYNRIGRIKYINAKLNEYIVPYVSSDNKKYTTMSLEILIANKLMSGRDKDKVDIEKIKECNGISEEKIKKIPLPVIKEEKLIGNNLEFTTTMPRIKLDIPKKRHANGFVSFATIFLLACIVACIILSNR